MSKKRSTSTALAGADVVALQALARLSASSLAATDERVALARPLAELVDETIDAAARSDNTARSYRTAVGLFLQYLDRERGGVLPAAWRPLAESSRRRRDASQGLAGAKRGQASTVWTFRGLAAVLRLVDAAVLDGYRAWRQAEGDAVNAAAIRVYAVRTFLAVALRDGILTDSQARALVIEPYRARQKRDEQPVGRRLAPPEVRALRQAVDGGPNKAARDMAILDVMLYAGLRRDEAASLTLGDFRQDGGRWWIVLTGKGQETRRVKVHDALYKSLTAWAEAAGLSLGAGDDPLFLAINKGDRIGETPINASVVGRLVAELGAAAGIAPANGKNRLGAHDLRRTCARNAYENGAGLLLIQTMLGHSDIKTTAKYIGAFDEDASTAVDFVHYDAAG